MNIIEDIGVLLARSPMPEEEKKNWLILVPHMPEDLLKEFHDILRTDVTRMQGLKKTYQKKFRQLENEYQLKRIKKTLD